jgi:hypothetical protein
MRRLALLAALTAAAAGCGGSTTTRTSTAQKLPRALARTWAARADAVAAAATGGDACRAQRLAGALRDDVIAEEERVPAPFRHTLLATVARLADEIRCTPPVETVTTPAQPAPGPGRKRGHEGKKHGKGHGKGGTGGEG